MQLTKEHIDNLYSFTKKHGVKYYDLQTELIDHIANDIEQIWQQNPRLTFKQAKYKATIKFGIYGFSRFVNEREKALHKKHWRLFKQYFKAYFKVPKLMLTLFLAALVYLFFEISPNKNTFLFASLLALTTVTFLYIFYLSAKFRIENKRSGKKWLFEKVIISSTPIFLFITVFHPQFFYRLLNSDIRINWSYTNQLLCSFGLAALAIIFYVSLYVVPPKMRESNFKEEHGIHKISE